MTLYTFKEGAGSIVYDRSGVSPALDLRLDEPNEGAWVASGLRFDRYSVLMSGGPATKLIDAARQNNSFSAEVWVTPAEVEQFSARLLTISGGPVRRNFSLIQGFYANRTTSVASVRLRTSNTDLDGGRALLTSKGSIMAKLTHIVYTRSADGTGRIYLNGVEAATTVLTGALDSWSTEYPLSLGREASDARGWRGIFHLAAFYDRDLSAAEVAQNFAAGIGR